MDVLRRLGGRLWYVDVHLEQGTRLRGTGLAHCEGKSKLQRTADQAWHMVVEKRTLYGGDGVSTHFSSEASNLFDVLLTVKFYWYDLNSMTHNSLRHRFNQLRATEKGRVVKRTESPQAGNQGSEDVDASCRGGLKI